MRAAGPPPPPRRAAAGGQPRGAAPEPARQVLSPRRRGAASACAFQFKFRSFKPLNLNLLVHKPRQVLSPRRRGAVSFLRSVSAFALGSPEPAVLSCAGGALCSVRVHAIKKMPLPFPSRPPPLAKGASIKITSPTPPRRGALRRFNKGYIPQHRVGEGRFGAPTLKAKAAKQTGLPACDGLARAGVAGGCRTGQPRRARCLLRWAALQTGALWA